MANPEDEQQPAGAGGAERRKTSREDLTVRVEYATVDELFSDFARNINEGGIFVESDDPQALGTEVGLQFRLPGSEEPIEARGLVVHVSDGSQDGMRGMGIEFGELDAETRLRVNDLVRALRAR